MAWLAICVFLAYGLYAPGEYGGFEWRVRNWAKGALYAVVAVCAMLWGWEGFTSGGGVIGLLSFYGATLWIVCFAVVELNVFHFETKEPEASIAIPTA